jgi:hypothetical protein
VPPESAPPESRAAQTFQEFWSEFRGAVKADDKDKIASLTAFPFETRGGDDSDPVKKHDKASFLKILDRLLDSDSGVARKDKMRSLIDRKAEISSKDFGYGSESDGECRVGSFVFKKRNGKWAFTSAFLEE